MLTSISLTSWRGIKSLELSLGDKTYIQGANGSGKTHILEAIHLLSGSHPLYGNTTLDPGTVLEAIFTNGDLPKNYKLLRDIDKEFFAVQGTRFTRPKYMNGLPWRTVYISPFDMNLLYFAPQMRRDAMDIILSRVYTQFSRLKRDYELTMRERNALLKKIRDGGAMRCDLDFWDAKFSELAETYILYRGRYVSYISESLSHFPHFFSKYPIRFHYLSSIDGYSQYEQTQREIICDYLLKNRERDIFTGHTHIGPHRDDWGFEIVQNVGGVVNNPIPAESYLSRGEMKMLLLGLKMIEADFIEKTLTCPVILLIDDIFAELDENNSNIFIKSLMQHQVILTSQKPLPNHEKQHDFICINLEHS